MASSTAKLIRGLGDDDAADAVPGSESTFMRLFSSILLTSLLLAPVASAQSIGGAYNVSGTNLDGSSYRGTAYIELLSDVTCAIEWTTDGVTSSGICMRSDNAFAAGYVLEGDVGMVIYKVRSDGRLDGTWTIAGEEGVGTEMLTPR